jgi:hypothetical protein
MVKILKVDYVKDFKKELSNIDKLEQTPNLIKNVAIQALNSAINSSGIQTTTKAILERNKESLENIGDRSISNNFSIIYSQMCILAVSSLEATLKKYFENALSDFSNINQSNDELKKIKISLNELVENNLKFSGKFGKLIINKANLNFQDLKSIKRIFSEYISKDIILDTEMEKKTCFFLEARHALVHKGGIADDKFIQAVFSFNANIKDYKKGDRIEINASDWDDIKNIFTELVAQVTKYRKN